MKSIKAILWLPFVAVAFAFVCATLGCKTPAPPPNSWGNSIPNFYWVDRQNAIARGGQPASDADWVWLVAHGITNDDKLNTGDEGRDLGAVQHGMALKYHPVDTLQQLVTGPDPSDFQQAVKDITPGTFVHCGSDDRTRSGGPHAGGQDRTGLAVGVWMMAHGTNASAAWGDMIGHGYTWFMPGLTLYFVKVTEGTNSDSVTALEKIRMMQQQ